MLPCMGARQTVIVFVVKPPDITFVRRWTSPRHDDDGGSSQSCLRLDPRSGERGVVIEFLLCRPRRRPRAHTMVDGVQTGCDQADEVWTWHPSPRR